MFKALKFKKMIKNKTSCIRFSNNKICPNYSSNHIIKTALQQIKNNSLFINYAKIDL